MKRVALVGALALGVLLFPTSATAQDTSQVSFIHSGAAGAIDLYIGPADAAQVDLVAANVGSGAVIDLGSLAAAKWRFLGCSAGATQPSIASCVSIGRPTTFDDDITIGADKLSDVVLGWKGNGSVGLVKFNIDTKCVTPGGRVTVANVAQTQPAVATVDGADLSDNLGPGKQAKMSVSAGGHTVNMTDGAALNLAFGVDVASQTNVITYVTGTPNFYGTLGRTVGLDCSTPPPTDPAPTPTAGASAAASGATRSAAVNPRYAG
jgi:hypothetical protein